MLADDIAWAMPQFRAEAEANMRDTCTITRPDPEAIRGPMDDETGEYPPLARLTVYSGKCRIQVTSIIANSSTSTAGERTAAIQGSELQLPILDTGAVAINDVAHIDTCELDPDLAGREFTISARHEKSQATSRRLRVIEVTG